MLQVTRSNLIEIKKNNAIKWYDSLPHEQKDKIASIAIRNRIKVMEEYKCNETTLSEQRQMKMKKEKEHQEALKAKNQRKRKTCNIPTHHIC